MLKLPLTLPVQSAADLWSAQLLLLARAEDLLGARDVSKKIYQPVFKENGPYIINTPDLSGAFVALSSSAKESWPCTIYELAHETVHLLNPVDGPTNWIEEGIAVAFSVHMTEDLVHVSMPITDPKYQNAYKLIQRFEEPYFTVARKIREAIGALSLAKKETLQPLFPSADNHLLQKLVTTFGT